MQQFIRRILQVSIIILLIIIPILSLYGVLAQNYRLLTVEGTSWQKVFNLIDSTLNKITYEPVKVVDNIKGSFFWSFTIYGYNISDPLNVVGSVFGSKSIYWPIIKSSIILVILTVPLGRVYCGWICPMYLVFEMSGKLRKLLNLIGIKSKSIAFSRWNKYAMLFVGATFSYILGVQVFSFIYPPTIFNREIIHLIYYGSVGIGIVTLLLIIVIEVSVSKRAWCRYFCPGGALWSLMGSKRLLRVKRDASNCDNCAECNKVCEFGLSPMMDQTGMECDNCGKCIANCHSKALGYKIGLK
jgi:ferredoxin-type protein NapH